MNYAGERIGTGTAAVVERRRGGVASGISAITGVRQMLMVKLKRMTAPMIDHTASQKGINTKNRVDRGMPTRM